MRSYTGMLATSITAIMRNSACSQAQDYRAHIGCASLLWAF